MDGVGENGISTASGHALYHCCTLLHQISHIVVAFIVLCTFFFFVSCTSL